MVNHKAWVGLTLLISLLWTHSSWSLTEAQVDRQTVFSDDTVTLTLKTDGVGLVDPDISLLNKDFYVFSQRQTSQQRIINGQAEAFTVWDITLVPKQSGTLTIPSLSTGDQHSEPITITVKADEERPADSVLPVFIESSVDRESVYVQEQLIYTLRIFQAVQLSTPSLTPLTIDNALVQALGQYSFDKTINAIKYRVNEISYAIFPQSDGILTIPPQLFSALQPDTQQSSRSLLNAFASLQGKPVRQHSQQHMVQVNLPPPDFTGSTWLPAAMIEREGYWSDDISDWRVGESMTRTIITTAQNLAGSQLPPITFTQLNGAKVYHDQGLIESTDNAQGISSTRTDSVAIIPTAVGALELPELRLSWWDTTSQQQRETIVPATTITIKPALDAQASLSITANPNSDPHTAPTAAADTILATEKKVTDKKQATIWMIVSLLLLLLWLSTVYFHLRYRQRHRKPPAESSNEVTAASEKAAFKQLQMACQSKTS